MCLFVVFKGCFEFALSVSIADVSRGVDHYEYAMLVGFLMGIGGIVALIFDAVIKNFAVTTMFKVFGGVMVAVGVIQVLLLVVVYRGPNVKGSLADETEIAVVDETVISAADETDVGYYEEALPVGSVVGYLGGGEADSDYLDIPPSAAL